MTGAPRPDFFLAGAFKCGTTAMHDYLRQHPQIFMPYQKEPLFFGDDLTRRYGRRTLAEYLDLFRGAHPGQRVGEASAWYLYSRSAASEIRDFNPEAQIIVMLRNPVEVMYAQHSQLLFNVEEEITDFGAALEAEPARRRGERLPPGPLRVENLFYRESVRFAEQLERYYETFGRDRVLVILYDDFRDATPATFREVLAFLGVDAEFRPGFGIRNPNKRVRFPALQRFVYQPPRPILRAAPLLRRYPLVHRLRSAALALSSQSAPREPMNPDLRRRLLDEFRPQVEQLGHLIGRDLSAWTA